MLQLTIMKIIGYGPWTLTLGSDREHELQMLQASLYQKVQELFSKKNGLVFPNRSDEFFAVTNQISLDDHIEIQKELESKFIRKWEDLPFHKDNNDAGSGVLCFVTSSRIAA